MGNGRPGAVVRVVHEAVFAPKKMKRRKRKKLSDLITYYFLRLIVLPPCWIFRIAAWPIISLGSSGWLAEKIGLTRRVLSNIETVFPEKNRSEKRRLLRQALWQTAISSYESERIYRRSWVNRVVTAEGLAYLDEALAKGKGVIALSAHLGNFTLILAYLRFKGYPIRNIGRDPSNPYLARYFEKVRQKTGIVHIPKNPIAVSVKGSLTWLKAGNILSLPSDQYTADGVSIPFFGRNVRTPAGPAVFARRLGCAVLPVSIVRRGRKHLIRTEPPLELLRTEDQEADIKNNTALFNRVIERWVTEDPEQWFGWFTRRFR